MRRRAKGTLQAIGFIWPQQVLFQRTYTLISINRDFHEMLHMLVFKAVSSTSDRFHCSLATATSSFHMPWPHSGMAIADPFHPERENLLEIYFDAPIIGNCGHGELYGFDHAAI